MNLSDDYQIMEIRVPERWVGDTIIGVNVRRKYGVNILAIHRADRFLVSPAPDMAFVEGDTLLVRASERISSVWTHKPVPSGIELSMPRFFTKGASSHETHTARLF